MVATLSCDFTKPIRQQLTPKLFLHIKIGDIVYFPDQPGKVIHVNKLKNPNGKTFIHLNGFMVEATVKLAHGSFRQTHCLYVNGNIPIASNLYTTSIVKHLS